MNQRYRVPAHHTRRYNVPAEAPRRGNRRALPSAPRSAPPRSRTVGRTRAVVALALLTFCGCRARTTRLQIVDYRSDGPPQHYHEFFDECYYSLDRDGNVHLVARRTGRDPQNPDEPVTQVVHIRSLFRPVPGVGPVEQTMINATISYCIVGDEMGTAFDGGGFVTFRENRQGTELTGHLESSALVPNRSLRGGRPLFESAEVTGTFRAQRDRRGVVRITNDMQRRFGPLPAYTLPPSELDLR